jgi:aminobenzoyl-glutamate transport protein
MVRANDGKPRPPGGAEESPPPQEPDLPEAGPKGNGPEPPGRAFQILERVGNRIPHAFWLFWLLLIALTIASAILAATGASSQPPGAAGPEPVRNIASAAGLQHLLTTLVDNFIGFPPLGVVLAVMIGVGIAEQAGFLRTAIVVSLAKVPRGLMPVAVTYVAGQGHVMGDASFIVLPPLAALAFRSVGRHPIAGMFGSFAATSAGYASGVLIGALDANLSTLTAAAVPHGLHIETSVLMNYFFQAISGLVLPLVVAFVLVRWVEPKLPPYNPPAGQDEDLSAGATVTPRQRRALLAAVGALAVFVGLVLAAWLVPGGPLQGKNGALINSPFFDGIVPLVMLAFLVVGIVYGLVAGTITTAGDIPRMIAESLRGMLDFVVIAFAAGQFLEMFDWSRVGGWLAVEGAGLVEHAGIGGFGALLLALLLTSLLSLVIFSGSALWTILAPVLVPVFAGLGLHPAVIQATYRVGDSITHPISPLNPFIYTLHPEARRYDPDFTLGMVFSRMALFVLPVAALWIVILAVFYFLGIPLGPGTGIHLGGIS